ncbi:MAG: hypothetical protein WC333_00650 [Dehalococcoidia bacterium]
MKILVALPDNSYFLWQMLVQINNFKKFGLEKDVIYLIGKRTCEPSATLMRILSGNVNAQFHVLNDTRTSPQYSSSMRPHIISKFFEKHPELENEPIFYIDPDVIFTKKLKTSDLEKDDVWYLSDTRSYIDSKYIKSKGEGLFMEMCEIVGIDPKVVEMNDENAGGAQYLMKNVDADFWKKVENDSENLFSHMIATSYKYNSENPIQAWTADMWALLWNAWRAGHKTKITKRLNFSWATDPMKRWEETHLFHNAGAVLNNGIYFLKTNYQKSPFNKEIECSNKYCGFNYVKEIKETEKTFANILF